MRSSEIYSRWLNYFSQHDHKILPSASLVSQDPSILFTIAGMVPFIPYIIGTEPAPDPRVATIQKCIRTNDIENVGHTTRHGTFFQMCGNFSFGDYFKETAIELAFGLLTDAIPNGGYGLEADRLWFTIWDEDKVSYDVLTNALGIDPKHVVKLTKEQIFWSTGQPGPAGPCCEIHYDRGPEYGPEAVGGTVDPGGDRYLEVWNLVFDEFLRGEGEGKNFPLLGELAQKTVDTGAGLERIAFLLQNKQNMYEIDQVFPIISTTEGITGKTYGANAQDDIRMRVVADHIRSSLMLISDGVHPGNDGREYVLRRLLRRAVRSIRLLGVNDLALPELLPVSMMAMKDSYPELEQNFAQISQIAYTEEESFHRTLTAGTQILDVAVKKAKQTDSTLSGADAFTLHDTYGFPIDLTVEMAEEKGIKVDKVGYAQCMQEQKDRARKDAQAKKTGHVDAAIYRTLQEKSGGATKFLGYTDTSASAEIIGLIVAGKEQNIVTDNCKLDLFLDRTPFYAEQGGQLADHGQITTAEGAVFMVEDVQMPIKGLYMHRGKLISGTLKIGEIANAEIDVDRRGAIARAHNATHMLHKVLHEYLGEQATQVGSENSPSRLRFDFRHSTQLTSADLKAIETRLNYMVRQNLAVAAELMPLEQAQSLGAQALFGEKYGDTVRVVTIGDDWSKEICTGTHTKHTGEIGLITIVGEYSVGSGVRRIEALVGEGAYAESARNKKMLAELSALTHTQITELPAQVESLMEKLKVAEKELAGLRKAQIATAYTQILESAQQIASVKFIAHDFGEISSADELRSAATDLRAKVAQESAVVAVFGVLKAKPMVVIATTETARESGIKAGALVGIAAKVLGGGGGGKPDIAQGGGSDVTRIPSAITEISQMLVQDA